jgi:hypothetical protein
MSERNATTDVMPAVAAPAVAVPVAGAPVANAPVAKVVVNEYEDRLRRIEDALASLQTVRPVEVRSPTDGQGQGGAFSETSSIIGEAARRLLPLGGDMSAAGSESAPQELRRGWFIIDAYHDVRWMIRMVVDPQYRMSLLGRVAVFVMLPFIFLSYWARYLLPLGSLIPELPWLLLMKVLDLAIAFVAFKILMRELARYRSLAPDYTSPNRT